MFMEIIKYFFSVIQCLKLQLCLDLELHNVPPKMAFFPSCDCSSKKCFGWVDESRLLIDFKTFHRVAFIIWVALRQTLAGNWKGETNPLATY